MEWVFIEMIVPYLDTHSKAEISDHCIIFWKSFSLLFSILSSSCKTFEIVLLLVSRIGVILLNTQTSKFEYYYLNTISSPLLLEAPRPPTLANKNMVFENFRLIGQSKIFNCSKASDDKIAKLCKSAPY